jgi:hypothetical protein
MEVAMKKLPMIMFFATLILMGSFRFLQAAHPHKAYLAVNPAALYQSDNELYFNNQLPPADVKEEDLELDPDGMKYYGQTWHPKGSHDYAIRINPFDDEVTEEETMLHEVCHVSVMENEMAAGEEVKENYHGPEFQDCMLTLAKKGAFRDLW